MKVAATQGTALLAGIASAAVMWFAGPAIDQAQGFAGGALLIGGALLVGVPAYYCVLGLKRTELVGLWVLRAELLKRIAAWLLGAAFTAAALSLF